MQHRTVLIIFPLILQTVIIAETLSTVRQGHNVHVRGKLTRNLYYC